MGTKAALIADNGDTGVTRSVTYGQLLEMVKQYAAALRGLGVKKGDRVAIYMPMGIEAAVIMLSCQDRRDSYGYLRGILSGRSG